jgi:hypothetical protein
VIRSSNRIELFDHQFFRPPVLIAFNKDVSGFHPAVMPFPLQDIIT